MSIFREAAPVLPAPRCPRDGSALDAQIIESTALHVCARCSGVWIDLATLVELLQNGPQMDGLALHPVATPQPGRSGAGLDNVRALPCVRCGKDSERRSYGEETSIMVDTCAQHGIWLDGGELSAIVIYARNHARPLPGDAVGARRAALQGSARRRPKGKPTPPLRTFEGDAERIETFAELLYWIRCLLR